MQTHMFFPYPLYICGSTSSALPEVKSPGPHLPLFLLLLYWKNFMAKPHSRKFRKYGNPVQNSNSQYHREDNGNILGAFNSSTK